MGGSHHTAPRLLAGPEWLPPGQSAADDSHRSVRDTGGQPRGGLRRPFDAHLAFCEGHGGDAFTLVNRCTGTNPRERGNDGALVAVVAVKEFAGQSLLPPPTNESGYADYQVHQEALRQADRFSERVGEHPDEDERLQLSILRFLRFQSEFVTKDYVLTTEIMAHLKDSGFGEVNGQRIRSSGVAKLRDADVIITSAAKGYKIPQTRADINDVSGKGLRNCRSSAGTGKKGSRGVPTE